MRSNETSEELTGTEEKDTEFCGMKRFYRFIKQKKTHHNGVAHLKVDGKLVPDKAKALNHQFQYVFSRDTGAPLELDIPIPQVPSMPTITVTTPEVYYLQSFFQCTLRDWNCLPDEAVMGSSSEAFKRAINV